MGRERKRYYQPPIKQHVHIPAPILAAPMPTPRQPRLNQKLLNGAFLILLSLLLLLIVIKILPSRTPWPAYQPLPSAATWIESSTARSSPHAPHKAIRKTLKSISTLVTELNRTLTTTCPGCIWRAASGEVCVRTFYDDGDVMLLGCGTALIVFSWVFGMIKFLGGAADIAPPFEERVCIWGTAGANVALAGVAFGGFRAQWYWILFFVFGAAFVGMILGVFATREEVVLKWKQEAQAEAEKLQFAERRER
ncbi:hypothetical protein V494_06703 [Pseudogymnoascus sp. VKM F-4513 (FW-928)]|nr:hypothetical protein V494_06703 [Pseudogymnoascus sp. VKM F-4513 (FW-928)]